MHEMNPNGAPPLPQQPTYAGPTPVRVMINTLAVLFVLGLVWLLIQVRSIILLLILGILLAAAVEPLVFRLRRRGFSRGQAILSIYAGIFAILGVGLYLVVPPLINQSRELYGNIPDYIVDFRTRALSSDNNFINTVGVRTINRIDKLYRDVQTNPPIEANQAIGVLTSVVGVIFTTVSVMIVAFYWMTEKAIIKRVVLGLFPLDKRDRAHGMWDEIEGKLGGWARGQLLLMLIIGLISTIAYFALDLPFWFLLGIWAGVTELIPFIGPVLGGAAAALVALTVSWEKALIVVVFVLILQQLESSVIVPRVMRNAVGLTPLSVILAVLIGGALLGPLGAILAIPVAAAVQVLVQDLLHARAEAADTGLLAATLAATVTGRPQAVPGNHGLALDSDGGTVPDDAEDAPPTPAPATARSTEGVH
jgi:predicted PurR-regulated permease PerM